MGVGWTDVSADTLTLTLQIRRRKLNRDWTPHLNFASTCALQSSLQSYDAVVEMRNG